MNYNFFLEIYSEEIPYLLQSSARNQLIKIAENNFKDNIISFKTLECLSTPKRLVLLAEEMVTNIILPSKVIKGPRVGCNDEALAGFMMLTWSATFFYSTAGQFLNNERKD